MFCSKCGTKNEEKAKYCSNCGHKLTITPDSALKKKAKSMDEREYRRAMRKAYKEAEADRSVAGVLGIFGIALFLAGIAGFFLAIGTWWPGLIVGPIIAYIGYKMTKKAFEIYDR